MAPTSELYEHWRQQMGNAAYPYQLNQQAGFAAQAAVQQPYDQYRAVANCQQYPQAPLSGVKVPELPDYIKIPIPEIPPMKPLKFIIFYALVAFGTFTWLYNHQEWGTSAGNQVDRVLISGFGAAGWPIYWSGWAVFAADAAITAAVPRVVQWWNTPAPDTSPVCTNEATGETVRARNGFCRFSEKHSKTPSTGGSSTGTGIPVSTTYIVPERGIDPFITTEQPNCRVSILSGTAVCSSPYSEVPHD